jgi:ribosomal protein S24E
MSLKVINEKVNVLFGRKELELVYESDKIPSNFEVIDLIADKYKVNKTLVRVNQIKGRFGVSIVTIFADIYDNQESFKMYVKKTKQEVAAEKKAAEEKLKAEAEARKKAQEAAEKPVEVVQ